MKTKHIFLTSILSLALITSLISTVSAQNDKAQKGAGTSATHKSAVAGVVQDLRNLADKDFQIGVEIRTVAKEQEQSNSSSTKAMQEIEKRGGFKTFLIGTDYKNIGTLRSEIVTTQNSIDRLTRAKERTTDELVKADLDAQIKALEEANTSALNFIQENENKFSLLGCLVRLFQ
mgnify:FL=1